jgi:predicted MFS family arabinose efflux permease
MPPLGTSFARLWLGETISAVGSQVTVVALPLTAVLVLQASVAEMGIIRALVSSGGLATALFAGVLADRVARRPLLVSTEVAFAALMALIPALALGGWLRIEHLYGIGVCTGALSALSIVAGQSFLPTLVASPDLARANASLQSSLALAAIAGPAIGGALVELWGPPQAVGVDAVSFLIAAVCIGAIRVDEPMRASADRAPVLAEIQAGFAAVYRHPRLRPLAQAIALHFVCAGLVWSVLILFASRELGIRPFGIGAISASAGSGLLVGSLLAPGLATRFGVAPPLVLGSLLVALGVLPFPFAGGPEWLALALLALGNFCFNVGIQVHGINLVSLRQRIVPSELLGRVNATFRFANFAAAAIGSLLAAALGSAGFEPRAILAVGAAAFWLPPLVLARALSALRDP